MSDTEPPLPPDAIAAMIAHMNDDHADAVLDYVHRFAAIPAAERAQLVAIDRLQMVIDATVGGANRTVMIPFDHRLADASDARDTLIAMARA